MPSQLPLDTLLDLARKNTDEAARALGRLNAERAQAEQQLALLYDYRQDYLQRLQRALQTGMAAADCHNYQRFISTLDDAIGQQNHVLRAADEHLARGRRHWQQARRRLNAFDALSQRRAQAARVTENRREQRSSDEYAARLARAHGHH